MIDVSMNNTISYLSAISEKARKGNNPKLNESLKELSFLVSNFAWLDINSGYKTDYNHYRKLGPLMEVMADLTDYVEEYNVGESLHNWHYNQRGDSQKLIEITQLIDSFILIVKDKLDEYSINR